MPTSICRRPITRSLCSFTRYRTSKTVYLWSLRQTWLGGVGMTMLPSQAIPDFELLIMTSLNDIRVLCVESLAILRHFGSRSAVIS